MSDGVKEWRIKALTDLWTGSVVLQQGNNQLRERIVPDRLVTTGLLGSIRWWFEVLVRGLGGVACDPSDDRDRCPDQQGRRCVICELFGCTGWARKFRFEVRDTGGAVVGDQIKRGAVFTLPFIPLRPILTEEWALLDLTLRLIAGYAAMGGKTVYKPSDEVNRMGLQHHLDYGIIEVEDRPVISAPKERLQGYVCGSHWRTIQWDVAAWASLSNFWCVDGKYLTRQTANQSTFNAVVGRDERKACIDCGQIHNPPNRCPRTNRPPRRYSERLVTSAPLDEWLAGTRQESKKVFSFKNPPRTFGFVNPEIVTFDQMRRRLAQAWGSLRPDDFVTGDGVLARLTPQGGRVT